MLGERCACRNLSPLTALLHVSGSVHAHLWPYHTHERFRVDRDHHSQHGARKLFLSTIAERARTSGLGTLALSLCVANGVFVWGQVIRAPWKVYILPRMDANDLGTRPLHQNVSRTMSRESASSCVCVCLFLCLVFLARFSPRRGDPLLISNIFIRYFI